MISTKAAIIIFSVLKFMSAQNLSCFYYTLFDLPSCDLSIKNPLGFNNFTRVNGVHDETADSNIMHVIATAGAETINFPSIICDQFRYVEQLIFNYAKIQTINEYSFKNCTDLEILNLDANKISNISTNSFANNLKLTTLILSYNKLTTLPENLLIKQTNLKELNLDFNQIESLPSNVFKSLKNLETLSIELNNIKIINSAWFSTLINLRVLSLSKNEIADISDGAFKSLTSIQEINLSENFLSTIRTDVFAPNSTIQVLDLTDNLIEFINRTFVESVKIERLVLDGNICSSATIEKDTCCENMEDCFQIVHHIRY